MEVTQRPAQRAGSARDMGGTAGLQILPLSWAPPAAGAQLTQSQSAAPHLPRAGHSPWPRAPEGVPGNRSGPELLRAAAEPRGCPGRVLSPGHPLRAEPQKPPQSRPSRAPSDLPRGTDSHRSSQNRPPHAPSELPRPPHSARCETQSLRGTATTALGIP